MTWPDHIKDGLSARMFQEDIIMTCRARIEDPMTGEIARHFYELILGHAYLDRENHAHGLLRDLVKADGTQKVAGGLDTAWDNVKTAFDRVMLPSPNLTQLQQGLNGIDHGGGGGVG